MNISKLNNLNNKNRSNIKEYRAKIINHKKNLKNSLFKTPSFNNEYTLKNMGQTYYSHSINSYNNNLFIDDSNLNETQLLKKKK